MSKINNSTSNSNITVFFPFLTWSCGGAWINWPEGMSYLAWQNLLTAFLRKAYLSPLKNNRRKIRKHKRKKSEKSRQQSEEMDKLIEILEQQEIKEENPEIPEGVGKLEVVKEEKLSLEMITLLKKFIERKKVDQHIESEIQDFRDKEDIKYSKQSIILSALSIFLFRLGSGNHYQDTNHNNKGKYSKTNMAKFIDAPEKSVPVIKTIEDFLKTQDEDSMNRLMITFFKELIAAKFFQLHPEIMPGDFFLLAADCVHTHTYEHPHHVDEEGYIDCPYCLKRIYKKDTIKEKVRWLHYTLVYCLVFFGHLKIPIYHYPIHAKQIIDCESESDDVHKQECEMVALKKTLPKIKEIFPKTSVVMLLDGLFANRPVIRLVNSLGFGYIIVRKSGNLPTLGKDCDGLAKLSNHKKNQTKISEQIVKKWTIKHRYEYFNCIEIGDKKGELKTNVLRFKEVREKIVKKKIKTQEYYCEWLVSWKVSMKNCAFLSCLARLRWEEEDVFNSVKTRGFKFEHDYSRDPRSFFNWHGLALFAFGIFELFRFSKAIKQEANISRIALANILRAQLREKPTKEIFSDCLTAERVQFRYCFDTEQRFYTKSEWPHEEWQKSG